MTELQKQDVQFLETLKKWLRKTAEYSVLGKVPAKEDLVYLQDDFLPFNHSFQAGQFIRIGDLIEYCERSTPILSDHGEWLGTVYYNICHVGFAVSEQDGDRLIAHFLDRHGILDERNALDLAKCGDPLIVH